MTTLTVSQVNKYIKSVLDEIPPIQNIYVMGEISNFKYYSQSGHMYFTLKDSASQLKAVMFSFDNSKLKFMPENGMNVVCFGKIGAYERDGVYQLYVHGMQPKGTGELSIAYEQLKEKLEQKGYFAEERKKVIPKYPTKIGVATSNMGAAVEDIKNVLSRRYPCCEIVIVPTIVQGDEAAPDIARSISFLDEYGVDTIIVGRGGGSIEDLWAFNTELVADAVYNCKTPVISAVGHETDFTICDFVSDLRAPTPSAAAELAVPEITTEIAQLENTKAKLSNFINYIVESQSIRLDNLVSHSALSNVEDLFGSHKNKIDEYLKLIKIHYSRILTEHENNFSKSVAMLNAYSPLAILGRGYSLTQFNEAVVNDINKISINDQITTTIQNGVIKSTVIEVIENE